jgi:cyanate lyase
VTPPPEMVAKLRAGNIDGLMVYGTTIKDLIHEEFGDGIMSANDFEMDLQRLPDPKGDRVKIVMHGKFLAYKTY